jgi:hypothetical protein
MIIDSKLKFDIVNLDISIEEIFYDALSQLPPDVSQKLHDEYLLLYYYRRYSYECVELGLTEGIDWQRLHEEGSLCKWAYENISELKKLGLTQEDYMKNFGSKLTGKYLARQQTDDMPERDSTGFQEAKV